MPDAFLNPYTFIPAFPRENLPEPLHDTAPPARNHLRPEAWTGRIPVTLTVETPLLLLDTSRYRSLDDEPGHHVYPVRLRDGRPHLPATTVKGMLRAAYEAGASVVELVEQHNISRSTVQRLLNEAGTAMRPAGQPAMRPVRGAADLDRLVDSWRSGA